MKRALRVLAITLGLVAVSCAPARAPAPAAASPAASFGHCGDQMRAGGGPEGPASVPLVYFTCASAPSGVAAVARPAPDTYTEEAWLEAALTSLLEGPTADEQARGLTSWFSADTAGLLEAVTVDAGGHAVVSFHEDLPAAIPNASTSNGARMLLAELNATVFDPGGVDSVEYRFGGSCEAFAEWLQASGCQVQRGGTLGMALRGSPVTAQSETARP